MTLKLEPSVLESTIKLPGSKSHANRYLILAARTGQGTTIQALPESDDVTLLLEALKEIGLDIRGAKNVTFHNSFPACESGSEMVTVNVGEGGTTARFLLALLCTGKRPYLIQTQGRLKDRPWEELIEALKLAGASIDWRGSNLLVKGPVDIQKLPREISATRSTQFASALQLVFGMDGYQVTPTGLQTSKPYWEMTRKALDEIKTKKVTVPADWSSAAYPMVFAAVKGLNVTLPGLALDAQADRAMFDLLKTKNCVEADELGVKVTPLTDKTAFSINVEACPDLVPALAFLAAHLEGTSTIQHVSVLKHKESDRLSAVLSLLKQCGVKGSYFADDDTLKITGGVSLERKALEVPSDHRMVMVGSLFLKAHKGGTITHEEAVNKSFPEFYSIFK